jgi:hypothetical protein
MHCCDTYALELLPAIVISSKTPFTCRQSTFCDRPSILSPKRKHTSHIGRMAQSQVCWACTVDLDSRCSETLKLARLLLPASEHMILLDERCIIVISGVLLFCLQFCIRTSASCFQIGFMLHNGEHSSCRCSTRCVQT